MRDVREGRGAGGAGARGSGARGAQEQGGAARTSVVSASASRSSYLPQDAPRSRCCRLALRAGVTACTARRKPSDSGFSLPVKKTKQSPDGQKRKMRWYVTRIPPGW